MVQWKENIFRKTRPTLPKPTRKKV